MAIPAAAWLNEGQTRDIEPPNDANGREKPTRRRLFRDAISPGPLRSKTFLTYFIVLLLVGINILLVAQTNFAADSTRPKDLLYSGERTVKETSRFEGDVHGTSSLLEEEEGYAARSSPMTCDLCPPSNEFCKSIGVVYEGSNVRLHRVLRKLRNGEPISFGVIGGSVSSGHGLIVRGPTDVKSGPLNLHQRIFEYVTAKYPHPDHKFTNGAVAATGSQYFATCFAEHIPEDVDLVMIELAINDIRHLNSQVEYEMLVRGVLDLPNKPAIINLHTVGLMFDPITQGGDLHLGMAHYYDLPVISLRSLILPPIMDDHLAAERFFTMNFRKYDYQTFDDLIDYRHISIEGHELLASLTNLYLERQFCKLQALDALSARGEDPTAHTLDWPSKERFDTLPKMMVTRMYNKDNNVAPLQPQCFSTMSLKHPLKPAQQSGWEPWSWKDKHYLVAKEPGSKASFAFTTEMGILKVFHQHSAKYGLGQADCWVDDDTHLKRRLDS
ncbi:hypothetical protein QFC21_005024 [Naganishia friedmannii]|uniref:Uncharacterized protein n=1 Tax=Naganishia friedmannii TaxID=89922 RepID=A0ACC2VC60_9TREE|nr:hypothetical protein QFC21_005024 [Naganishia friedmannii]